MAERKTRALRLCPCPPYDVEGMESWLSDLAARGLLLEEDGLLGPFALFTRGEPRALRYRAAASMKGGGWLSEHWDPPEDTVELSSHMGWEYVARRGDFFFFRTPLPAARELNSDPEVQALALAQVKKRQAASLVCCLFWLLLYLPLVLLRGSLLLTALDMGTGRFLLTALVLLWLCLDQLRQVVHLGRLRKRLLAGQGMDHGKNWRGGAFRSRAERLVQAFLVVLVVVLGLQAWSADVMDEGRVPLAQWTEEVPFATMADFAPGGTCVRRHYGFGNTVKAWSDLLAPVNLDWDESADLTRSDGSSLSGGLQVRYHEVRSEALAALLARDYLRAGRWEKGFEALELPDLGVDFAAAYLDRYHFPTVILQQGDRVVKASFFQSGGTVLSLAEWAGILADSIQ